MAESCEILICSDEGEWLQYDSPVAVVQASTVGQISESLRLIEERVERERLHAIGFVSYEAAPAFDSALEVLEPVTSPLPLLWFALFDPASARVFSPEAYSRNGCGRSQWIPSVTHESFLHNIDRIREYIAQGDTYQVNYTYRLRAQFWGDAMEFFLALAGAQRSSLATFIRTKTWSICSASPELFFERGDDEVICRPMKGTIRRGKTAEEDEMQRQHLANSAKDRAENVMIADMVRNDLGRIARVGSVHVPHLFQVEEYPTLFQLTSTVAGRTDASLTEVLGALFPSASITGAPKVRTMQIIRELESSPRGIYCGCIGSVAPGNKSRFAVAIRTAVIDEMAHTMEYGVGGGIVWDSDPQSEYEESILKARILEHSASTFALLESILWEPARGGFLLDRHLARMAASTVFFNYRFDEAEVRNRLEDLFAKLPKMPHKVRLLLHEDGRSEVEAVALDSIPLHSPYRVRVADEPVSSDNIFLRHKTTCRAVYDQAKALHPDCDDVLLCNEKGELTESTLANLVLQLDGELVTPEAQSGLLPGTYRQALLEEGKITERRLMKSDLERAEKVFLINSVRKWIEVELVQDSSSGAS